MRSVRIPQLTMLGYPIERIEEHDRLGQTAAPRFEVLCPWTGAVLRNVARLRQARRYVLMRELGGLARRFQKPRPLDVG